MNRNYFKSENNDNINKNYFMEDKMDKKKNYNSHTQIFFIRSMVSENHRILTGIEGNKNTVYNVRWYWWYHSCDDTNTY